MGRNKGNDKRQERDERQERAAEAFEQKMAEARERERQLAKDNQGPYDDSKHAKD